MFNAIISVISKMENSLFKVCLCLNAQKSGCNIVIVRIANSIPIRCYLAIWLWLTWIRASLLFQMYALTTGTGGPGAYSHWLTHAGSKGGLRVCNIELVIYILYSNWTFLLLPLYWLTARYFFSREWISHSVFLNQVLVAHLRLTQR